ncbi:MAG: hypothetical protein AAGD05_12145 [Bacteroidota bacterium]
MIKFTCSKAVLLALSIFFLGISCSGDDDANPDNPDLNIDIEVGELEAKIDGETFQSTQATGTLVSVTGGVIQSLAVFGAQVINDPQTPVVNITFFLPTGSTIETSTYQYTNADFCDPMTSVCAVITYTTTNTNETYITNVDDTNASINITSIDFQAGGHIAGTFSGRAGDGDGAFVNIAEGKFNVRL